jgi:hypothetical protein
MDVKTCAHPACQCQIEGREFCGDHCKEAARDVAKHNTCDCGHPQCRRKP